MELVTKTDDRGNTITFKRYQGRAFNKNTVGDVGDQLEQISSFRCKPDDVLMCTFPKSGTHWTFNMARMIQTKTIQYSGTPAILEFQDIGVIEEMESPRMFHTHLTYPFIPKAAMEGHLKVIYVLRNPKDVACSYFTFMSKLKSPSYVGSFDGFLNVVSSEECAGSGGSWFTHTLEWNNAMLTNQKLRILFLRFEDMKKNLYGNIVQIAKFLEVDYDEAFLRKVESAVTFENLKEQHSTITGECEVWKHQGNNGRLPIYRKGMIGDWKNMFTVAQNDKFDDVYQEKMSDKGVNLQIDYE